ncbi:MAG: hypothetical protein AAF613_02035 [Pseudomonadota bacterium]
MDISVSIERLIIGLFVGCMMLSVSLLDGISLEREQYSVRAEAAEARQIRIELTSLDIDLERSTGADIASVQSKQTHALTALGRVRTTASMLNRRACASIECTSYGMAPHGTVLDYYEVSDSWLRVSPPDAPHEVWVSRDYAVNLTEPRSGSRLA